VGAGAATLFTLVVVAGFCTLIAMCRTGIQVFWADGDWVFPAIRRGEAVSVVLLLALCLALTVLAEAPLRYVTETAAQLHAPAHYIQAVLP
jgi:multicomponent K+:H+ antiporter subunit D